MKTLAIIAFAALTQMANAQSRTIEIKPFTSLAIGGHIEVTLVQSKENKVVVAEGDDNLKVASVKGSLALNSDDGVKLTLHYNGNINELAVAGGVEFATKGKLKTDKLNVSVASGSEVRLEIDAKNINAAVASGAEMIAEGTTEKLSVTVGSGGDFIAEKLKTDSAEVTVASGADAKIFATGTVDANVASGGDLAIYGNPKKVNEIISEGGDITVIK